MVRHPKGRMSPTLARCRSSCTPNFKFGMNGNTRALATSPSPSQNSGSSSAVAAPASSPAPSFSTTEGKKRQLYNPGTATWTDAPDDPAAPAYRRGQLYNPGTATWTDVGDPASPADVSDDPAAPGEPDFGMTLQRGLWEALAGPAPPPPPAPAPAPEPEPEDSGLKFANAAPAAELLAPVFVALQVASYADTYVPGHPYCTSRAPRTDTGASAPEAQGSLLPGRQARYVRRRRTSLGHAVRTAYRVVHHRWRASALTRRSTTPPISSRHRRHGEPNPHPHPQPHPHPRLRPNPNPHPRPHRNPNSTAWRLSARSAPPSRRPPHALSRLPGRTSPRIVCPPGRTSPRIVCPPGRTSPRIVCPCDSAGCPSPNPNPHPNPDPNQGEHARPLHSLGRRLLKTSRRSMVKVPPLAAPQVGSCASSERAWRLWAARHYFQEEAEPLAAPEAAEFTAFDHSGGWGTRNLSCSGCAT